MLERHVSLIAAELGVPPARVRAAAALLQDGATLPFIARYRKEATGGLDEVALARIRDRLRQLASLDARRASILSSLSTCHLFIPSLAEAIVAHRARHGPVRRRRDPLTIPRLGLKAYEQAAAFLRIPGATNPLDDTAVHPESYPVVDDIAANLGLTVADLVADPFLLRHVPLECYVTPTVGLPTLQNLLRELAQPSRDPGVAPLGTSSSFQPVPFSDRVRTLADLKPGMTLPDIVANVTHFGAFVDVGLPDPGLLHRSTLPDPTADPTTLLQVHQPLAVTVLSIDPTTHRLSLSLVPPPNVGRHGHSAPAAPLQS